MRRKNRPGPRLSAKPRRERGRRQDAERGASPRRPERRGPRAEPKTGGREKARPRPQPRPPTPRPEPEAIHRPEPEGLACGFHAVRTALEQHPRRVERVLLARDQRDHRARLVVALAREAGVPFQQVPRAALDRLAGELAHQGIAARLAGADLLEQDELIERLPTDAIALALDGVEDPRNVGAILRSAAGLGAHGVFLPVHRSAGLSPAAMKTAAGGLDVVPVARAGNLNRLIELLADRGLTPVALDVRGACAPWDAPLAGPVLLIAGSEEKGVRASVLERCRVRVAIPTAAAIGSLNVSVAVGIVLAEAMRQRKLAVLTAGSGDPGPVSPDP